MADEDLGTASITIELDETSADNQLDNLSDRIERALNRGARDGAIRMQRQLNAAIRKINPLVVEITADTTRFRNALNAVNNLGSTEITVVPAVDPERFRRELQRRVRGIYVRIPVQPDFDGFDAAVRAHRPPEIDVRVKPDVDSRALSRVTSSLSGALSKISGIAKATLAFGALGIAAAGAASSIAALVAALAPAAGILAAGPAVILGYQAALGSLKLALAGVGDAFSAALTGDAKEFEKSLEDLSPQAQAAAREVRALKPAFETLRNTVQDSFFSQFEGDITRTATALQGPLTKGLANIGKQWGEAARGALGYIQGTKGVSNVKDILDATGLAVDGLARGSNKLTAGILQAGATIAKAFGPDLQSGIQGVLDRFGTFLQTASEDGRLVVWVEGALNALATLGAIIGNIGSILNAVFSSASAGGAGFLENLNIITQKFEDFVESAEGQEAIGNIFKTLQTVGAQLGPIFQALITTLGGVVSAIQPLLTTIGPAIVAVIQSLGPVIAAVLPGVQAVVSGIVTALEEIASSGALADIGKAFGDVLSALAPVLPVIGELVAAIGTALAPVISALAEAVTPVIRALAGALTPILPPLVDVVLQLVDALTPLLDILGTSLASVITAVAPLLLAVAQTLGVVAQAVAPLIVQLTDGLAPIIESLAPFVTRLVTALLPLVTALVDALLPVLPPIIDAFLAIMQALVPLTEPVVALVEALAPLLVTLTNLLAPVLEFVAGVLKWATIQAVVPFIETVVTVILKILTAARDVTDGIQIFVTTVVGFFTNFGSNASRIFNDLVTKTKSFFSGLWADVVAGVSGWVASMISFFTRMKDRTVAVIQSMINSVLNFFRALPGQAASALSALTGAISNVASSAARAFVSRITSLVSDAVNVIRRLPGQARAALGSLGSVLFSAGQDMIRGLINGVKSMAGSIASAAKSVVKGAVDGAKDFLGIQSPSKVFREIGVFVGKGFVQGLTASEASIRQTADKLAKLITDAFKGKKTNRDETLIRAVRETQSDLESLTRQREALAKRIQAANEFAAQTTQAALQSFSLNDLFGKAREDAARPGGNKDVFGGLTDRLEASAARIRRFTRQLSDLAKRGVRKDILSQLIGLGPDAGADLAQQLSTASAAQLRELNSAQAALDAAAKKFGQNSADQMFDAGKNAAKGFLAGLRSQQKEIENLMISIAKGLTRAIKQALGIKSPSRVLADVGEDSGLGLIKGLAAMRAPVTAMARQLAATVVDPFAGSSPVPAAVRPVASLAAPFGSQDATAAATAVRRAQRAPQDVTVNNNVVINEVGNAEATATRVLNRLALSVL